MTYGQLMWTDAGRRNWQRVRDAGFEILYWGVDQEVSRKLARRFTIERGHPKQHYDAAVNAVPVITAKQAGVPLIIYAEHGESFYGGHVLSEQHRRRRDLAEVLENQVGDDARNWAADGITQRNLYPYIYPDNVGGIEAVYWSYYHRWSIYENAMLMRNKLGFEWIEPRTDGSFEGYDSIDDMIDGLDFYLMYLKFGFGRATRMASRLIQEGVITRDQGLEMVTRHDGEFPEMYLPEVCKYLSMSRSELEQICEKHRNQALFEHKENG